MVNKKYIDLSWFKKGASRTASKIFTWNNILNFWFLFMFVAGFLLWKTPGLKVLTGNIGLLMVIISVAYTIHKYRKEIKQAILLLKVFLVFVITLLFFTILSGGYYKLRQGKMDEIIQNISKKKWSEFMNQNSQGLRGKSPNILKYLYKYYKKRIISFLVVFILSLNYFVVYNNNASYTKMKTSKDKDKNELFWTLIKGFLFGLFVNILIYFRYIMIRGRKAFKPLLETVGVNSLICGLTCMLSKYIINGPLEFLKLV